jgi:hypothetical protein
MWKTFAPEELPKRAETYMKKVAAARRLNPWSSKRGNYLHAANRRRCPLQPRAASFYKIFDEPFCPFLRLND